jgi:hypothetical protein
MKKFELIVGIITIPGIVLKLLNVPGSGILIALTLTLLSMFYYVFSFAFFNNIKVRDLFKKVSYQGTNAKRIIGAIGLGCTLSIITLGGLFKLQLWSGSAYLLIVGLNWTGIILIIASFFYLRAKADYYTRIFKRIAIYGGLGVLLYLTPINTLIDMYYGDYPEYADLYKQVLAEPENIELQNQLEQMGKEMLEKEFQDVQKSHK